jgi:cytochrome P450/NADPH-cytochrome P450 reductase
LAIITASYEGMPTDDAAFFFERLKSAPKESMAGVKYAVFGCGHPDWAKTFYAVPEAIENMLADGGAERLLDRGKGDVTKAELFDGFDDWATAFIDKLSGGKATRVEAQLAVSVDSDRRKNLLQHDFMQSVTVVSNIVISHGGRDVKRHLVFRLPEEATYRTGDYFAILPTSPLVTVRRALIRLGLHADDLLTLSGAGATLPLDTPISAFDLFAGFVELSHPVSHKLIQSLPEEGASQADIDQLRRFRSPEVYESEIAEKRISLLDLLEMLKTVQIPLGDFIKALPPLRMRQVRSSFWLLGKTLIPTVFYLILASGRPSLGNPHRDNPGCSS